jgi:putative DNA primase/helicase
MDILGDFIDARCIVKTSAHATNGELYRSYDEWAHQNGVEPVTKQVFGRMLKERGFAEGFKTVAGHKQRIKIGIGILVEGPSF